MVLATDLDGTFLGGKSLFKQQLYDLIRNNKDITLVFVTGRGLESVIPLLNDPIMPNPDYIICDVGATIVNGHTLEPVESLQYDIEKRWPGNLAVMETIKDVKDLEYQKVPQQRRCSFYTEVEKSIREVRDKVVHLDCEVIFSADRFLDVVLKGVNKGSSLINLIKHLGIDKEDVLVAGDTLNDMAMYECHYKGVAVGNAEKPLKEAVKNIAGTYIANGHGAAGILEAMTHFGFMTKFKTADTKERYNTDNADIPQLIMMYHRFPYEKKEINGKIERVSPKSPNGVLPTLQSFFADGRPGIWLAWEEVEKENEPLRNIYIDKKKYPNLMASRIGLTKEQVDVFYKVFAKEAFWPTIFAFVDKVKFNHHHWDHFVNINRMFAKKAAEQADEGAMIWIHDYNLWLVPGFLRQLRPDLIIGFFHHTAFPAANTFNILPWRREIISSLLQCDYIGFHIPRYVENFNDVVKSLFPVKVLEKEKCAPRFLTYSSALGVNEMTTAIDTGTRTVRIGANPVGINVSNIEKILQRTSLMNGIEEMRSANEGKKIILSVERLDYVKGPLEKILAFEQFLEEYPEFQGQVELINICTPAASGMKIYDQIKHDLEHAIGRINGRFSRMDWTPVRLFSRSVPFDEVIKYYAIADIAWITPLRDGLNLVAKEYIAVQGLLDKQGVLILSEFAGASVELPYAIVTNPYDPRSLKESLLQALTLTSDDKKLRMERLFQQVLFYDIDYWASDFIRGMINGQKKDDEAIPSVFLKNFDLLVGEKV
ncbi:MAG: glucosylglycerol-phosphate synthase [Chitinophagaceae bacterium]